MIEFFWILLASFDLSTLKFHESLLLPQLFLHAKFEVDLIIFCRVALPLWRAVLLLAGNTGLWLDTVAHPWRSSFWVFLWTFGVQLKFFCRYGFIILLGYFGGTSNRKLIEVFLFDAFRSFWLLLWVCGEAGIKPRVLQHMNLIVSHSSPLVAFSILHFNPKRI